MRRIPRQSFWYWGKGTAFPYCRYLSMASFRIQHPDWPTYLYRCTSTNRDKWGAVFQDFQFNGDELNKIWARLAECQVLVSEPIKAAIYAKLLPLGEPQPWDKVSYSSSKIEALLREKTEEAEILAGIDAIIQQRKERDAKRPPKHDYIEEAVKVLGAQLKEYEPSDERVYSMPPPNVSDIFSVEILIQQGGWYFDCDQLVLRNLDAWSDNYDFLCGGQVAFYIGIFASKQNGAVVSDFYRKMLDGYSPEYYNSTGITAIVTRCVNDDSWMKWFKMGPDVNQITPQETFYPLCAWDGANRFWNGDFEIEKTPAMCVHYFGGHALSQKMHRELSPENIMGSGNNCLVRWMKKVGPHAEFLI